MENTSPRNLIFNLLALGAIIAGLYLFFRIFDIETVQARITDAGVWAPLLLVFAKASTIVLVPLSGSPLYPIAGALFGFWKGFFLLVTGDVLGGTIAFLISRYVGRGIAERLIGGQRNLVTQALEMMSTVKGFLLARLCFVTFPEIPAYAAGLSRIPFVPFIFIYTLVGAIPTAVTAALGAFLTSGNNPIIFGGILFVGAIVSGVSIYFFTKLLQDQVDKSASQGGETIH